MGERASSDLEEALAGLERAKRAIAALMQESERDVRHEVVQARRELADRIALVGAAGERLFAGTDALPTFRLKWAAMRSTTALHQAKWPAVLLGERADEFRTSTEPMRAAGADFLDWTRGAFRRS